MRARKRKQRSDSFNFGSFHFIFIFISTLPWIIVSHAVDTLSLPGKDWIGEHSQFRRDDASIQPHKN